MEPEEQTAVLEKLRQLKMDKFEELIVKRLMREERELEPMQKDLFGNNNSPYVTFNTSDRALWNNNSTYQTLDEDTITHMKEHIKQLKATGKL
jgi:hypothetical protein